MTVVVAVLTVVNGLRVVVSESMSRFLSLVVVYNAVN